MSKGEAEAPALAGAKPCIAWGGADVLAAQMCVRARVHACVRVCARAIRFCHPVAHIEAAFMHAVACLHLALVIGVGGLGMPCQPLLTAGALCECPQSLQQHPCPLGSSCCSGMSALLCCGSVMNTLLATALAATKPLLHAQEIRQEMCVMVPALAGIRHAAPLGSCLQLQIGAKGFRSCFLIATPDLPCCKSSVIALHNVAPDNIPRLAQDLRPRDEHWCAG
jgi:hypothetical protein